MLSAMAVMVVVVFVGVACEEICVASLVEVVVVVAVCLLADYALTSAISEMEHRLRDGSINDSWNAFNACQDTKSR